MKRIGICAIALGLAGCGGSTPFAWLTTGPAPRSWSPPAVIAGGSLARPPGWQAERGDPGSVSFVAPGRDGSLAGYLNATPRSGAERLSDWTRFRLAHNAEEGDRDVRLLSGKDGIHIGAARASCVIDQYRTRLSPYRELACLIADARGSTVVLGAAPPARWPAQLPVIERAIAGFLAG